MKAGTVSAAPRRKYQMNARARAAAATGERILDAAMGRFSKLLYDEVTLAGVAADAGVSEQTIIRRFGTKEELFAAVGERESVRILGEREPDDTETPGMAVAVRTLLSHYESDGRTMLNFLNQEARSPVVAELLEQGREVHEAWVTKHLASVLGSGQGQGRQRRLAAAIAATDLYTWKLLRLDRGMSPREVEGVMLALLEGLEMTSGGH